MNIILFSNTGYGTWRGFTLVRVDNKLWWQFKGGCTAKSPPEYLCTSPEIYECWNFCHSKQRRTEGNLVEYKEGDLDCFTSITGNP